MEDTDKNQTDTTIGNEVKKLSDVINERKDGLFLPKMMEVKGGSFYMGCHARFANNGEKVLHYVTLDKFYIGKQVVTQTLWESVMGYNPSCFVGPFLPVDSVAWYECIVFCNKMSDKYGLKHCYEINEDHVTIINGGKGGFRLPTEAEWEFAARGDCHFLAPFYAGGAFLDIKDIGWYKDNSEGKTHPVGLKTKNGNRLNDINGNVWEWCWDRYDRYQPTAQVNPTGQFFGPTRVCRGGSWNADAENCHVTDRNNLPPDTRSNEVGFRLVVADENDVEVSKTAISVNEVGDHKDDNTVVPDGWGLVRVEGGMLIKSYSNCAMQYSQQFNPNLNFSPVIILNTFYIGKYTVTQKQWMDIMGTNPSKFQGDNRPVESLNDSDVDAFCSKLNELYGFRINPDINYANMPRGGFRLPTDEEWEYAALGGNLTRGYLFSGSDDINKVGWHHCNETHDVGQKLPNELGLYDMSGNVREICKISLQSSRYYNNNLSSVYYKEQMRLFKGGGCFDLAKDCVPTIDGDGTNGENRFYGIRLVFAP